MTVRDSSHRAPGAEGTAETAQRGQATRRARINAWRADSPVDSGEDSVAQELADLDLRGRVGRGGAHELGDRAGDILAPRTDRRSSPHDSPRAGGGSGVGTRAGIARVRVRLGDRTAGCTDTTDQLSCRTPFTLAPPEPVDLAILGAAGAPSRPPVLLLGVFSPCEDRFVVVGASARLPRAITGPLAAEALAEAGEPRPRRLSRLPGIRLHRCRQSSWWASR